MKKKSNRLSTIYPEWGRDPIETNVIKDYIIKNDVYHNIRIRRQKLSGLSSHNSGISYI